MALFKTLIVEDNPTFRQTLVDILSTRFPRMIIEEATDGREALQKTEAMAPDLIFMDVKLPGENGLELTQKIKAANPEIMVIVLTGYDLPEYREAAFAHGANYFLVKGSSTNEEILALVETVLSDLGFSPDGISRTS